MTSERDRIAALTATADALAGRLDLQDVLNRIVAAARDLTGARYAALGVLDEDGHHLRRFVYDGIDEETARTIGPTPTGSGVLGVLVRDPHVLRLEDIGTHPASSGFPPGHPPMTSFLGAPVRSGGQVFGNLYLSEKPGGFDADDETWVTLLAAQAGAAVANAALSERLQDLAVQQERDRISRDLHDGIIQTLFSLGMNLESSLSLIDSAPDRAIQRIEGAIDGIDQAIRDLRNTIFHLRPNSAAALGLSGGLVELAREYEVNALVRPAVDLPGTLDAAVRGAAVPDLLQIAREALSNAARHARASKVTVRADLHGEHLVLEISDDGVGFESGRAAVGRGLDNMRERAAVLEGALEITSERGEGTTIRLVMPRKEQ